MTELMTELMKTLKSAFNHLVFSLLTMTSIIGGIGSIARAEKMNTETHSLVIEKLEKALSHAKEDETVSLRPVRARLADLYAERARLRSMDEAEKGCSSTSCTGARDDRRRALSLYRLVEAEADQEVRGSLLLQMAHLHLMNGERTQASQLYERIVKEGSKAHSSVVLSQGFAGRGESRFAQGSFAKAKSDFEQAVRLAQVERKGPLVHRIAWCELNLGEQPRAVRTLVRILKTPDLLTREATNGPTLDISFQDDVVSDLGTFLARGTVGADEIALVASLSPERTKRDHLKHLASETERLGNKRAALMAWEEVASLNSTSMEQLETLVRVTQLRYDLGQKPAAKDGYEQSIAVWKTKGCKQDAVCSNLRVILKNLVIDWNRVEKKSPSENLLAVYRSYLSLFDTDMEMMYGAALVARELKYSQEAVELYHKSSLLAVKSENSKGKRTADILESSLVGEIEMAELAKNFDLRESAYDHYLKLSPKGQIAHKVRYQRARLPYERGNNPEAVERLVKFATSDACRSARGEDETLCVQAADIELDARVILKDDRGIEVSALEYAGRYPSRRAEYLRIARTSAVKQVETMNAKEEWSDALTKLSRVDMTGADRNETMRLLRTRLVIAEKAKDLGATKSASKEILRVKGLTDSEKELALSRLAWAAEMGFEFRQAYRLTLKLKMANLKPADREMRLAVLAELGGLSPRRHEEKFLELSRSLEARAFIRAKLVRASKNPTRELSKHIQEISRVPKIFAPLALEIYAKTGDQAFAERLLSKGQMARRLAQEPAGRVLARQLFLKEFARMDQQIANHRIYGHSEALMQSTLSKRLSLLGKIEGGANRAIANRDWTAQLVSLSAVSRENKRLSDEILALPVPRKLKGKDRETYTKMVALEAKKYADQNKAIELKIVAFWKDEAALGSMIEDFSTARPEIQALLGSQLKSVAAVAPSSQRRQIERALQNGSDRPSSDLVASAAKEAQARPFNEKRLAKLRELEAGRGRETMVAYLDARLLKLKSTEGEKR